VKRTDIRAGVVYAVKASYGPPSPIVFLEDGAAGLYRRPSRSERGFVQVAEDKYTKAKRGTGWSGVTCGYAAVIQSWTGRNAGNDEGSLAALCEIDAAAELERFRAGEGPASDLLQFDLITSLARIVPWGEAVAEHEAQRSAERKRRAEQDARSSRQRAVLEGLRRVGFAASAREQGAVGLSLEDAERLLATLAGREG
jgi:hypothetical protein